jgi:hypothetical protein
LNAAAMNLAGRLERGEVSSGNHAIKSAACEDDGQVAAIAAANSLFGVPRVVRGAQKVNRVAAIQGTLERNTPGRVFVRAQH